ncbi:carboxymuconolactone decarboxylase family protein [Nocardia alni]|uniref:carboxymuconolactone decarboxylase family protein n=1 Tax=Nocardia alni TaxID=2815723 RepID=UPI001C24C497|nr:carboxymuconolactone decarboxylase family protein [Nocardia alni]
MRLPPLPADEWNDRTREAFKALLPRSARNPEGAGTAMSTLARHPDLAEAYVTFGVHLNFRSTLPARLKELVILRVAVRRKSAYIWTHHLAGAAAVGLSGADIDSLRAGSLPDVHDQTIIEAVDELDELSAVSDRTWSALCGYLTEQQCMDLVFTAGGYMLLAMAYNTFGVQPE